MKSIDDMTDSLNTLFDSLSDGILLINREGIVAYLNGAARGFLDISQEWDAGNHLSLMLQSADLAILLNLLRDKAESNEDRSIRYARTSGANISTTLVLKAVPVQNRSGVIVEFAIIVKDTSSITRLENELGAAERRSQTLIDAVPQIIWENNAQGRAIYFNKRWYDYSGLSYAQSEGPGWPVIVHSLDRPAVEKWHESLSGNVLFFSEVRLRRHDGEYEWHLLRNVPLKEGNGEVSGWFGTATNIHDQKTAELKLKVTSKRLQATLEAASDFAIITLDKKGVIVDWNSGAQNILGYTREEAVGKFTDIFFTPEDKQAGMPMEEIRRAEASGHSLDERWHIRKDGSRFFMSGVMTRIVESDITGYVKVARNITDRKLTEEALFLSEQRKSIAIQSTQMGEWDWDILTNNVKWNRHAIQLLGIADSLTSGFTQIHPDDLARFQQQIDTAIRGSYILETEYRVVRGDKKEITWVSMYGRVIAHVNERPTRMIGVVYDISARKMLEKQKDDFISIASHELKTPVSNIRGYSQLVLQALTEQGDLESAELLMKMNGQVERLTKLLYTLLDSTSMQEGRLRLNPEPFNLNRLIEQEIEDLRLINSHHHIEWNPANVAIIHADKGRIGQVITNLISNATKYSAEETTITVSTEDLMDGVLVKVRDEGVGISVEEQARIFERYYRGGDQEWNQHSFGLGLYISLEIIKQHSGSMGVESTKGAGSTFYFKLPYT